MRPEALTTFEMQRPRLLRLAYRMLGSHAEAEDMVQEVWLRWQNSDHAQVEEPAAWLTRVVSRLCLDQMKSARSRRETYPGTWLPEPLIEEEDDALRPDNLTLSLMMALERLSPLERVAFLLHDVFGQPMDEELTRAFFEACKSGDATALSAMLAEGATLHSDGGGKVHNVLNVITGADKLLRMFESLCRKMGEGMEFLAFTVIDGLPGFVSRMGGALQTTALEIEDGRIARIYITRNPDKLTRLQNH
ncbi:sigma factor [Polyangium sp. y55x31]|uniref:sigma factor n=1 Tax=Polyangium sp. y55x31 TaxID=3042688 RepID=UPI002482A9B1|nr:sigma factor [Polyangium sp. y55x31]MDI1480580.1 sigma factor [Polyangium sp. y55x31]